MLTTILAILVSATIDSTTLFIGDQTDVRLSATCEVGEQVVLPVFDKELIEGVEIVDKSIVDTSRLKDGRVQYNQYLTLTSFQDSLFYISPLPFVSGGDTLWSEGMTLNVVQPFETDSTDIAITDIKDVYKAPIWWWEFLRWVLLVIGLAGIGVAIYYLVCYLKRVRTSGGEQIVSAELLRPADEVAIEKLDALREQKLWQRGQVKEFHTELTDIVREYLSRRFDVSSVEQTSDETLHAMRPLLKEQREMYDNLHKMLTLADLVKFAKWSTTPDENEKSMRDAYAFVKATTMDESVEDKEL